MDIRYGFKVDLVQHVGSDEMIARAARVSTGNDLVDQEKTVGLIRYLMREKHTSPFEHCSATFRVEAPIFVVREWMRHRTQSYSELSLRYTESGCEFYLPPENRPLVNEGSSAHPKLSNHENGKLYSDVKIDSLLAYEQAENSYINLLEAGVAKEVARNVLPVATYTSFYATANLNNWLKFLDLRNGVKGHPQWEIVQCALQVQEKLTELFPVAMEAWKTVTHEDI